MVRANRRAVAFHAARVSAAGRDLPAGAAAGSRQASSTPWRTTCGNSLERCRVGAPSPIAAILDGRTLQSTPKSGGRAGYDGAKRKNGLKVHAAVDALGRLLALTVTSANEQERQLVAALAEQVQAATGETVTLAYVDPD